MANPTYLELVNDVLNRLREPSVTVLTDDYSLLIGKFVNDAKRMVENAWNWSVLRKTLTVSVAAADSDNVYSLTNGTTIVGNSRTRILEAWNTTKKIPMVEITSAHLRMLTNTIPTQTGSPRMYCINSVDTSGVPEVTVWPKADASETLTFYLINPQDDLSAASDTMVVPKYPVQLLAYFKAIVERGEDGGNMSDKQLEEYKYVLGEAIAQDAAFHDEEITWRAN
jgi:hypothetical protein